MKRRIRIIGCVLGIILVGAAEINAGEIKFKYRDASGHDWEITPNTHGGVLRVTDVFGSKVYIADPAAAKIINEYLNDVQKVKDRVAHMKCNVMVTISADLRDPEKVGSFFIPRPPSPEGYLTIQIQTADEARKISTLAHEVGHAYMFVKCDNKLPATGQNNVQMYGKDEAHVGPDITNERSAFTEGYAEYIGFFVDGDTSGYGPDEGYNKGFCLGFNDKLSSLYKEGGSEITFTKSKRKNEKGNERPKDKTMWFGDWRFDYVPTKWAKVKDSGDMFSTEFVNAKILKDLSEYILDGDKKIDALLRGKKTLKDLLQAWVQQNAYPEDADMIARIVDADTNFTMDKDALRGLTGANEYIDKERDAAQAATKGSDSCESLEYLLDQRKAGNKGDSDQTGCIIDNETMGEAWGNSVTKQKMEDALRKQFSELVEKSNPRVSGFQCGAYVNINTWIGGKPRDSGNKFGNSAESKLAQADQMPRDPVPGDVLITQGATGGDFTDGHVAIVLAYDRKSGMVWVAEANVAHTEMFGMRERKLTALMSMKGFGLQTAQFSPAMQTAICKVLRDTDGNSSITPWHPPMAPMPNPPGSGIIPPPTEPPGSPGLIGISPRRNSSGGTTGGGHWDSSAVGEGYKKGTYQKTFKYNQ